MIKYQMTTGRLRSGEISFGEDQIGFSHKDMVPHSLQSGFSVKLFLAWVYPETITTMGRWSINDFLCCTRIQVSDQNKFISALLISTHNLYIITEAELIHYNLDHSWTHICRLHP